MNIVNLPYLSLCSKSCWVSIKIIGVIKKLLIFLINKKTIKLCAVMEILKASISDGLSLY